MSAPLFATPIGKQYRWFAWHPVNTGDRGWQWLRFVRRQRFQSRLNLPGPVDQWFHHNVDPEEKS